MLVQVVVGERSLAVLRSPSSAGVVDILLAFPLFLAQVQSEDVLASARRPVVPRPRCRAPTAEWGMLAEGRSYLERRSQMTVFPGAVIFLIVHGFNLLGDGFRDAHRD